jgi:hypothetical protein
MGGKLMAYLKTPIPGSSLGSDIAESQVTNLVSDLAGKQTTGNYITALTGGVTASGPGSAVATVVTNANMTGDVTSVGNASTLATVNSNVGSFGTATQVGTVTVNAKGLVTAASNTAISVPASAINNATIASGSSVSGANTGDVTVTDTASVDFTLGGQNITASVLPAGVDHNSLANLATGDVHTQYALLAGRATPQQLSLGTASGANTGYISSTSNATKGKYFLDAAGTIAVDELNARLGVNKSVPLARIHGASATASTPCAILESTDDSTTNPLLQISGTGGIVGGINALGHLGVATAPTAAIAVSVNKAYIDQTEGGVAFNLVNTSTLTSASKNTLQGYIVNSSYAPTTTLGVNYTLSNGIGNSTVVAYSGTMASAATVGISSLQGVRARIGMSGASPVGTISETTVFEITTPINSATGTPNVVITKANGLRVQNQGVTGVWTAGTTVGITVANQTNGTNNFNVLLGTTSLPTGGNWSIYNASAYNTYMGSGNVGFAQSSPNNPVSVGASTTSRASMNIAAGTAPTSPVDGDMWADSTQKSMYAFSAGVSQSRPGVLFTQTADKTVTNTVTETSIIGTGVGTLTLPANFFVAGKTIRLRVGGVYSTPALGSPAVTVKVKYGSTVLATVTTTSLLTGASSLEFDGEVAITCRTTGVSGTVMTHGDIEYATGLGGTIAVNSLNNGGTATTINTTTSNLLDVTVTWDSASVDRIAKSTVTTVEVLN